MLAAILTSKIAVILNFCKSTNGAFVWSYDKHADQILGKSVNFSKLHGIVVELAAMLTAILATKMTAIFIFVNQWKENMLNNIFEMPTKFRNKNASIFTKTHNYVFSVC